MGATRRNSLSGRRQLCLTIGCRSVKASIARCSFMPFSMSCGYRPFNRPFTKSPRKPPTSKAGSDADKRKCARWFILAFSLLDTHNKSEYEFCKFRRYCSNEIPSFASIARWSSKDLLEIDSNISTMSCESSDCWKCRDRIFCKWKSRRNLVHSNEFWLLRWSKTLKRSS